MLSSVGCSVGDVVGGRMMFRVIVCHVCCTFVPIKAELALCLSAVQPVEAHPDHFNSPLDDCVVDESRGSGIVCLDG